MPSRKYSYCYPSRSEDSYRVAPPLPYGRRKARPSRANRPGPWDRDYNSTDSFRIAPKPKPWRKSKSRKGHDRDHGSRHEAEEPRKHSKPKSKRRSARPKDEFPADIRDNPFFKDIFEGPKGPRVRKPRVAAPVTPKELRHKPDKQRAPKIPTLPIPTLNAKPVNLSTKKMQGAKKAGAKTSQTVPPPMMMQHPGIPPPPPQVFQPPYPAPQGHVPPFQPPPPPPPPGQHPGHVVVPPPQGPAYNFPGPYNNVLMRAPVQQNLNKVLKTWRDHYERIQSQNNLNAEWSRPATAHTTGYQQQHASGTQPPGDFKQYLQQNVAANAEAQARNEKAQRDLAAATAAHEKALENLEALKARGPEASKSEHKESKRGHSESKSPYLAELERNAQEAAEEAKIAKGAYRDQLRQGRSQKRVSIAPGHTDIPFQPAHLRRDTSSSRERSEDEYWQWREKEENRRRRRGAHWRPREIPHDPRYEIPPWDDRYQGPDGRYDDPYWREHEFPDDDPYYSQHYRGPDDPPKHRGWYR